MPTKTKPTANARQQLGVFDVEALPEKPGVYVLHSLTPYRAKTGKKKKTAQHYVGAAKHSIRGRVVRHFDGRSRCHPVKTWLAEGIPFVVADFYVCDTAAEAFELEIRLKAKKRTAAFCPCCERPSAATRRPTTLQTTTT